MAATLGSLPIKSVCDDSVFTAISSQVYTGEERYSGLKLEQVPEEDETVCLNLCPPEDKTGRV